MPRGRMEWFDPRTGEGRIKHLGRRHPVRAEDIADRDASMPGARVHFDVRRKDGVSHAVNVTLRHGTRVSRRQRRFGTLSGAGRPDHAGGVGFTRRSHQRRADVAGQPRVVVEQWAVAVADNDVPTAVDLYAPDAVIHEARSAGPALRPGEIVSRCSLRGTHLMPDISGNDPTFLLTWNTAEGEHRTRLRIAHGEIVEQWAEELTMA